MSSSSSTSRAINESRVMWPNNELIGPNLNKIIFAFFPEKKILAASFNCSHCTKKINPCDYRDQKSKIEYSVSGLCQFCQDSIFNICW